MNTFIINFKSHLLWNQRRTRERKSWLCLYSKNVHQCVELSWGNSTMLLMKKVGHRKDVFKHYCPVIPNAIRIYFPNHLNSSLGAKHTQIMPARKQKSNNSGWATAELDLLSSSFVSLIKSCSPVSSQIPGVYVPTWPPASVIRWTEGTDCTVSYNN